MLQSMTVLNEHDWNCKASKNLQQLHAAENLYWKGKEAVNHVDWIGEKKMKLVEQRAGCSWRCRGRRKQDSAGQAWDWFLTGLACKGQPEWAYWKP